MAILPENHKNLILDFDGVITHLIVDWPVLKTCLNQALKLPEKTDRHTGFMYARATNQFPVYQQIVSQFEQAHLDQTQPSPLIQEIVSKRTPFAIVSNNCRQTIQAFLSLYHLDTLCYQLVGCDDVNYLKPHPEGILSLVKSNLNKYVYLGDQLKDKIAAKLAGVSYQHYQYEHKTEG